MSAHKVFIRRVAIPTEHGSWVFLATPLIIGLCAGAAWSISVTYLLVAALSGFLARHTITVIVKVSSGRGPRGDLTAAWFWSGVYALIGGLHVAGLVMRGHGYLLYLAIPGILVFVWHLVLVRRRAERRQVLVESLAAGVLALCAPAAYWVGKGGPDTMGWVLFGLCWAQSVASIVHVYLRLEQRRLGVVAPAAERWRMARPAILWTSANVIGAAVIGACPLASLAIVIPFGIQWLETIRCAWHPAVGVRPVAIGLRQLAVSAAFTVVFVLAWRMG